MTEPHVEAVDDVELARHVAELLHGRTIATAESCTAGRIAEVLACVEHAATFLRGGVVAYQEVVKRRVLGVKAKSVLTTECACEMAIGVARLLDTGVAVATTGVAGDEAVDGTPPGTVYVATAIGDLVTAREYRFAGSPEQVCDLAKRQALRDLVDALSDDELPSRTVGRVWQCGAPGTARPPTLHTEKGENGHTEKAEKGQRR